MPVPLLYSPLTHGSQLAWDELLLAVIGLIILVVLMGALGASPDDESKDNPPESQG